MLRCGLKETGAIDTMKFYINPIPTGAAIPSPLSYILIGLALIIGVAIGYLIFSNLRNKRDEKLKQTSNDIIAEARDKASQEILTAKDEALNIILEAEGELKRRRNELTKEEERLGRRREELDSRWDQMQKRDENLNKRQSRVDKRANEIDAL